MANFSQGPTLHLADLQKVVEQMPTEQQREVLRLVEELMEGGKEPASDIRQAQVNLAEERINRAIANPATITNAQAWLTAEKEKRGW
ncbi:MAG: hypothetical protein AAFQ98_22155 [Bacteroidota bacterium]